MTAPRSAAGRAPSSLISASLTGKTVMSLRQTEITHDLMEVARLRRRDDQGTTT